VIQRCSQYYNDSFIIVSVRSYHIVDLVCLPVSVRLTAARLTSLFATAAVQCSQILCKLSLCEDVTQYNTKLHSQLSHLASCFLKKKIIQTSELIMMHSFLRGISSGMKRDIFTKLCPLMPLNRRVFLVVNCAVICAHIFQCASSIP